MKKAFILLFSIFIANFAMLNLHYVWASSPNTISYQGRLRESGQPVSGIRGIQFKLFDTASAGTPVFDSGSQSIYVSSGIFGYQLGGQGFKDLNWATSSYWLEISVGGNAMSPREQINAMPYAFMASTAASLNGSGNIQITGAGPHYISSGTLSLGGTNPTIAKLYITGDENYERLLITSSVDPCVMVAHTAGTIAAPAAVNSGAKLGFYQLGGYDGTTYSRASWVTAEATEAWSSTNRGSNLMFFTTPNGSVNITERMRVGQNGNVGIGTTAPSQTLEVSGVSRFSGSNGYSQFVYGDRIVFSSPIFYVINIAGSVGVKLDSGATAWSAQSDIRLKENIATIQDASKKVMELNGVLFSWKEDKDRNLHPGLLAQDVEKVLPEAVSKDEKGYLNIRYTELIPLLVNAIKEQQQQINGFKNDNDLLRQKNQELENRIKAIEKRN